VCAVRVGVRIRVIGALAAVLLTAACGVPLDGSPRDVTDARVPYRSGAPAEGEGRAIERLCFVRAGGLVRALRRVPAVRPPEQQLHDLLAGPTTDESTGGLSSALSTATGVTMTLNDGRATVDIGPRDVGLRSDDVLAFGQIVCTLTSQLQVGTVAFTSGGVPLGVPRADGSLSDAPLTIADYVRLLND
jgi:spore germination protein GerM